MVNPMEKAVNNLFQRLGQPAKYNGTGVKVLIFAPDEVGEIGFINTVSPTTLIRIRVSDAPELKVGDTIKCGDDTYHVMSEPTRETHKLIWRAPVSCN